MKNDKKILNSLMVRLWNFLIELNEFIADATDYQRETALPIYDRLSEIVSTAYMVKDDEE